MQTETSNLSCLLYVSTATGPLAVPEVETLLSSSRSRNEGLDITGLLLYYQDHFIQVLEGPVDSVQRVYSSIQSDPRHHRVETMVDEPLDCRFFPDWSMAYRRVDQSTASQNASLQKILTSKERGTIETVKRLFEIFEIYFGGEEQRSTKPG